jgi:pimeloyl-ACP methyl ester carboxylesterase
LPLGDSEARPGPLADAFATAARSLAALARTAAFWLAIVLPFLHVPLLVLVGFTDATTPALVGLWGLNVVALAAGAGHDPDSRPTTAPAN